MVEYGQGVSQVSGGGGLPGGGHGIGGGSQDLGGQLAAALGDAGHQVAALPLPLQLLLLVALVIVVFWVLQRVF
jgi:hypothetical protein